MIFNSFSYFLVFLLPTAIAFRISPGSIRPWIIVAGGSLFYLNYSFRMSGVFGALCLSIFLWESALSRLYSPRSRWCLIGMIQSLVVLGIFKYWNFATGLAFTSGHNPLVWAGAFLPLGISFFTFEFYHYASDRRNDKTEPGTWGEYLAFILFFPTMVAGPIKRYQDFLPNLRTPSPLWSADFEIGTTRILTGLAKKFVIADLLTSMTDHLNANDILAAQRWVLPIWLIAYAIKIYIDFSAYSDIAIGSARLFGISIAENFDWPYLRPDIADFWRHWHISLTKWLTDYVFIPLGGSRTSPPRVYMNVIATMLVSGLWHGAGLNFLVWGLWHGILLCIHRLWRNFRGDREATGPMRWTLTGLTQVAVVAGWAFFCMDLRTAGLFYNKLLLGQG
jgi:alginate O-acetyltransferase complex protein AlgI